jgi:cell division protein FtsW
MFKPEQFLASAKRHWNKFFGQRKGLALETGAKGIPSSARFGNTVATMPSSFDTQLMVVVALLVSWGLVMVYSTSISLPEDPRFSAYKEYHFLVRHLIALAVATLVCVFAFQVSMETWERWAPWLFVASLVLLIAVLIPWIGKSTYGARRWLAFGPLSFQPSELVKFSLALYAAGYMVRKMEVKERFFVAVGPMAISVVVLGLLLLAEPDMGAFMVIAVIAMGILFLGGVNARIFFLMAALIVFAFGLMIAFSEWRRERIFAYLDPWNVEHVLGKGYQLSHSLIALGRGKIFGVGLGASVEKLHWLPEAHTDFMLAVIGEEFGLVGVLLLIALFFWLTRRIMHIGRQAIALERLFSGLVAQGVGIWMGFQAFINIGVNLGALPTKGLTLPLMSYGGSAIILNLLALTVVARVDYENKLLMRGGRP